MEFSAIQHGKMRLVARLDFTQATRQPKTSAKQRKQEKKVLFFWKISYEY